MVMLFVLSSMQFLQLSLLWLEYVLLAVGICSLSGCNKTVFDMNYTFNKAIIPRYDGEQIQLELEDGTILLVSSYNCILVNEEEDSDFEQKIKQKERFSPFCYSGPWSRTKEVLTIF